MIDVGSGTTFTSMAMEGAFLKSLQAATAMMVSHGICCSILFYLDLSGKWNDYALSKTRSTGEQRVRDYWTGWTSFLVDLSVVFLPFMTFCFYHQADKIDNCTDTIMTSIIKLAIGYFLGKIYAFFIHYALHHPRLYPFHRRHHRNPKNLVASAAWEDSFIEYCIMEIPAFAITVMLFPTHFYIHLIHFAWHGWDGACGHSGFKAPGLLGFMFDGEYHYYHHAHLTVNYAELEVIDKLFGTHHSQRSSGFSATIHKK